MLNLLIDSGNTRLKAAFSNEENVIQEIQELRTIDGLKNMISNKEVRRGLISDVAGKYEQIESILLENNIQCLRCNSKIKLPFQSNYSTPKTLGDDRIAAVAAASMDFKNQNVLVIDAGTCITYDFINSEGVYLGGAISPGLKMRFLSLNTFTSNLPLIEMDEFREIEYSGKSTKDSILSGVFNGLNGEIQSFINNYYNKVDSLVVLLGGGDRKYFESKLKGNIFARENLILEGLNSIFSFHDSH